MRRQRPEVWTAEDEAHYHTGCIGCLVIVLVILISVMVAYKGQGPGNAAAIGLALVGLFLVAVGE